MKTLIKNHIPRLSIPAIPGIGQALHIIKNILRYIIKTIMKGLRFFFPPERKFYYPREKAAFKHAMDIKKNSFPGQGPPR